MKKLTKIKLVNWHLFSNQTIDITDNALISGENGSGKSTLLDAVQYILVGGRGGAKFNIAATDDARRTLEGYVRGRIGAENKEHIRSGDVISHVALEFFDEQAKEYSIIGVVLDLPKNATIKERFYIMNNLSIRDDLFLDDNYPRDYRNMRAYYKTFDLELKAFDTQKAYREALARFFGMDANKYAKILPKALAFRPIDLQDFVFEFLLDDQPIDIQGLKNNVEQLKKVELQIKRDKEKLEKLDKIVEVGEQVVNNENQKSINELVDQLNWVEQRENFIKKNEGRLLEIEQEWESLREEKRRVDDAIIANDDAILTLEKNKGSSDVAQTIQTYQDALNKKNQDLESQKEILFQLSQTINQEFNNLKQLQDLVPSQAMKSFVKYYETHRDNLDVLELSNHLSIIANDVQSYLQAYHAERENLEIEKQELSEKMRQTNIRISQLRRHVKTYPIYVEKLIESLNQGLSEQYQKDIRVRPLAELIEVNDEHWRNAVEGYLNTQRFDIIVEPHYFDDALEIYESVKTELKIYGVGLVNTNKLAAYDKVVEGTLATKVDSDHMYARYYVNMLLNTIHTVETVHELKNYNRSITPTAMTYSNYTARQINPRVYQTPFIGSRATELQINLELANLQSDDDRMESLYNLTTKNDRTMRLLRDSKAQQIIHQNQLRFYDEIKTTRKDYALLADKLEEIKLDPSIKNLESQLERERELKRQLRSELERVVGKIATIRGEQQQVEDYIDDVKQKLEEFSVEQRKLNQQHPEKINVAQTQFYALKSKYKDDHEALGGYLARFNVQLSNELTRLNQTITILMRDYINEYHFSAAPQIDYLNKFIEEAYVIREQNLVKYEANAIELRKNSEIGFKEEFVNKLRASIQSAQLQIDELNVALDGKKFGTDTYQLITRPSDNPEFKQYYDLIMGGSAIEEHTLFTEGLSRRKEQILMELFNKIASTDPENDKLIYTFLDYRNYMSYDIEVLNENGNKSYFSKVSREKSGGETQVPFYIVIAASFQQLLSKNRRIDSGCIVLFDEAFNNMDESRIDAMMKFYNSLSIQLVIAVPPQRVSNIINYVTTSLVIVKDDDYAIVESFQDERDIVH